MLGLFADFHNVLRMLLVMVIAYLLGSLNIAIIVTKIFTGGKDIRTMGSGNAGFTNVMRSVGTAAGILTFIGDFLKCVAAVIVGGLICKNMTGSSNVTELSGYGRYLLLTEHTFYCIIRVAEQMFFFFAPIRAPGS